jgi:hypothetical protein
MISTTRVISEQEYLLPRNIIFELINKNGNEYTVLAKPFKQDQFTIKTGCYPTDFYDIVPHTTMLSTPPKAKPKVDSIVVGKVKISPVKLKRCPKGMVRNKITNECVPKDAKAAKPTNAKPKPMTPPKPKAKPIKAKLERCPNGTRRNPKTLLCEVKR